MNNIRRKCLLSWQILSIGFGFRIIMVAGKRSGDLFRLGQQWWFHFRDFNIRKDTPAAKIVLNSGIPLVLIPFERSKTV